MATRQYIGARYTPKFSGTYDATQAYEALEVVDNGSGTTYIARKPVPPNTSLTNTEYWLVYGASSGAILDLQSRVSMVESEIPVISSSILSMGGQIENVESAVSAVEAEIDIIDDKLNINLPENRQIIIIGDSYGMKNTPNYLSFLREQYPNNIRGTALSSYGFIPFVVLQKNFQDILNEYYTTQMTAAERNTITDIVVLGGWNDANHIAQNEGDVNTILAKIREMATHIKTYYPNAIFHVGFVGWQTKYVIDHPTDTFPTFADLRIAELAYTNPWSNPNIHVLDACRYVMRDINNFDASYFHPNGNGGLRIAYAVMGELCGHYTYQNSYSLTESDLETAGVITSLTANVSQVNALTSFYANISINGTPTNGVLGKLKPDKTIGVTEDVGITIPAQFSGTMEGTTQDVPCLLQLNTSGELQFLKAGVHSLTGTINGRVIARGTWNNKYNI